MKSVLKKAIRQAKRWCVDRIANPVKGVRFTRLSPKQGIIDRNLYLLQDTSRLKVAYETISRLQDDKKLLLLEIEKLKEVVGRDNPSLCLYEKERSQHEETKQRLIEKSKQLTLANKKVAQYREFITPESAMKKLFAN